MREKKKPTKRRAWRTFARIKKIRGMQEERKRKIKGVGKKQKTPIGKREVRLWAIRERGPAPGKKKGTAGTKGRGIR